MDKLEIMQPVGFPLRQDRIEFMQTALRNGIIMLGKAINSGAPANAYIVSGCVFSISGGTYSVTAGIMVFNGEPCAVPAHSGSTNTNYYWYIDEENANTAQTFADASSQYPDHTRQAKIGASASGSTYTTNTGSGLWIPTANVPGLTPAWIDMSPLNGWTTNVVGYYHAAYRIFPESGRVELRGAIENPLTPATADTFFTLPSAPAKAIAFLARLFSPSNGTSQIDIDTSGNIKADHTLAAGTFISLEGLYFYLS